VAVEDVADCGFPEADDSGDLAVRESFGSESENVPMSLGGHSRPGSASEILGVRDRLQVIEPDAGRDAAEMIQFQALWDGAFDLFPVGDMRPRLTTPDRDLPVTHWISRAVIPEPAGSKKPHVCDGVVGISDDTGQTVMAVDESDGQALRLASFLSGLGSDGGWHPTAALAQGSHGLGLYQPDGPTYARPGR
jgi:hypothetical protein